MRPGYATVPLLFEEILDKCKVDFDAPKFLGTTMRIALDCFKQVEVKLHITISDHCVRVLSELVLFSDIDLWRNT